MNDGGDGGVEEHGAVRNTAYAVATLATSSVFTAGVTFFLIRYLGPDDYGIFSVAISVGAIVAMPADFGISFSTARFVAENLDSRVKIAEILLGGLRVRLATGLIACGAFAALAEPIANAYDAPSMVLPIRLTAIAVFAQGLGAFFLGCFEAMRVVRLNFRYGIVESTTEAAMTVVLVLLGAGAAGAAGGRAFGFATALAMILFLAIRLLGWDQLVAGAVNHRQHVGKIARYGVALLVIDGAVTLFNRMDVLIIGAYKGTTSAGVFEAALRLVTFLCYFGLAISAGFAPRLSAEPGHEEEVRSFWGAARAVLLLQLLIAAGMVVWATPVSQLAFGSEFSGSAEILRALAPFAVLAGLAPLLTIGANYLGEARKRLPLAIGAVLVNLIVDLILVPPLGAVAGAIGSAAAFALYVPGHLLICRADVGMPDRQLALSLLRGLLAAAAAAGVLLLMGTDELSIAEWVGGFVLAPTAFLLVLVASGEIPVAQVRATAGKVRSGWENRKR